MRDSVVQTMRAFIQKQKHRHINQCHVSLQHRPIMLRYATTCSVYKKPNFY